MKHLVIFAVTITAFLISIAASLSIWVLLVWAAKHSKSTNLGFLLSVLLERIDRKFLRRAEGLRHKQW